MRARTPAWRRSRRTTPTASSAAAARSRPRRPGPRAPGHGDRPARRASASRRSYAPACSPPSRAAARPGSAIVLRPGRNPLAALAAITAPLVGTSNGEGRRLSAEDRRGQEARQAARSPATSAWCCASRARRDRRARSSCSSISSRSCTRWCRMRRRAARVHRRAGRRGRRSRARRSGSCCRCARTSSTASPRTRPSWPRSAAGLFLLANPGRDGLRDALRPAGRDGRLPARVAGHGRRHAGPPRDHAGRAAALAVRRQPAVGAARRRRGSC
jgi:hypothetical protein